MRRRTYPKPDTKYETHRPRNPARNLKKPNQSALINHRGWYLALQKLTDKFLSEDVVGYGAFLPRLYDVFDNMADGFV
jgi:hypothetical protein